MKHFFSFWSVFLMVTLNLWDASGSNAGEADPPVRRVRKATSLCGLEVTISSEAVTCPEETDGSIKIEWVSGEFPMTVSIAGVDEQWTSGDYVKSGLPAGDYTVEVTDNTDCKTSEDIFIDEPELVITAKVENICPTATYGAIIPSMSSTQPPYTQTWYLNNTSIPTPDNTKRLNMPGTYKIVLQDSKGCENSVEVELKKLQAFGGTYSHEDILCQKENSGIITITNPVGGSGNSGYLYQVKDSNGAVIPGFDYKAWDNNIITGLPGGKLTVTVKESDPASAKCTLGEFTETIDTIRQLNPPVSEVTASPLTRCDFEEGKGDGKIHIKATHPAGKYSYWYSEMPADQFVSFAADDDTDGDPLQATVNNLPAGKYQVIVQEESGCASDTLETEIEKTKLSFTVKNTSDPTCLGRSDGKVEVTIDNGTPSFHLKLTSDGKPWYAEDPDFPGDFTTPTFEVENVSGGTYTFVISDDAQCSDTAELKIDAPELVFFDLDSIAPSCKDDPAVALGALVYEITGIGSPPSSLPSTAETYAVFLNTAEMLNPAALADTIKGLAGGEYEVAVRIMSGAVGLENCIALDTITLVEPEPPVVIPDDDNKNPTCVGRKDGEYAFTVDHPADAVYEYYLSDTLPADPLPQASEWKRGYDATGTDQTDIGDITIGGTAVHYTIERYEGQFTGLDTGMYYLWIRDTATHCIYTEPIPMEKEQRLSLEIDTAYRVIDGKICDVEVDLTLTVTSKDEATSLPYAYKVEVDGDAVIDPDPANITVTNPAKKQQIPVKIEVTDAIGCSIDSLFTVIMPLPVQVDMKDADTLLLCNQDGNGYIRLQGHKDSYLYEWRQTDDERYEDRVFSTADTAGNLTTGIYAVHVTDSTGLCYWDSVFEVKARHYVEVEIDAGGKSQFCPDEEISLSGTVTVDKTPFTLPDNDGAAWWQLPTGDSLVFLEHNPVSFKADKEIPEDSNRAVLTAAWKYPDTTCVSRDTFPVAVLPAPELSFSDDTVYIPVNETYPLYITASPDFTGYRWWSVPDGHAGGLPAYPAPLDMVMLERPERPYYLILELENTETCRTRDSILIGASFEFFIPNAFTPNGDGIHDVWRFYPLEQYALFYTVEATVFNRAGVVVFNRKDYSNDPSVAFDGRKGGKDLPVGTYYYVVKLIHRQTQAEDVYTGSVTIIR
jgi:gliding motility-associated-like protein